MKENIALYLFLCKTLMRVLEGGKNMVHDDI
jgi:hypothetical protein